MFYIGFLFHPFKSQLSKTLQSYVILTFFSPMHMYGQPQKVMRRFTGEHNVHEQKYM